MMMDTPYILHTVWLMISYGRVLPFDLLGVGGALRDFEINILWKHTKKLMHITNVKNKFTHAQGTEKKHVTQKKMPYTYKNIS